MAFVLFKTLDKGFGHSFCFNELPCFLVKASSKKNSVIQQHLGTSMNNFLKQGVILTLAASGTVSWECFDLFGGVLCLRKAWEMIQSAAMELWGIATALKFTFNVSWIFSFETK